YRRGRPGAAPTTPSCQAYGPDQTVRARACAASWGWSAASEAAVGHQTGSREAHDGHLVVVEVDVGAAAADDDLCLNRDVLPASYVEVPCIVRVRTACWDIADALQRSPASHRLDDLALGVPHQPQDAEAPVVCQCRRHEGRWRIACSGTECSRSCDRVAVQGVIDRLLVRVWVYLVVYQRLDTGHGCR